MIDYQWREGREIVASFGGSRKMENLHLPA